MHAPEQFEQNKDVNWRDLDVVVPLILSHFDFSANQRILDYGCGAGSTGRKFLVPLAEKYDWVIDAVDISREMIDYAQKNFPHNRVTYSQGNILDENFDLEEAKYHRIVSIHVFHYIKNYNEALNRLFRLLKPGGQLGFSVVIRSALFNALRLVGQHPTFQRYMEGFEAFIPQWFEQEESAEYAKTCFKAALTKSGFTIQHIQIHYRTFTHSKIETMIELYMSLNPFINRVPHKLLDELRNLYRRVLCQIYNQSLDSQSIEVRHELLTAVVEKRSLTLNS